jgi:phenylpyruvate tautomerase PptA (4-oxalocrotonate tautomerase family)
MPLVMIDVIRNQHDESRLRALLDAVHDAIVVAFDVPATDRYQILTQHHPFELVALDTGLGLIRTNDLVIIRLTSKPRSQDTKQALYQHIADNLQNRLSIAPSDIIVTITENADADWSFGNGVAQFLTGALP